MVSLWLAGAYLLILLLKSLSAGYYQRHFPKRNFDGRLSDVAILQPILSGDPNLETTLGQNVEQLSEVHFCWLVDNDDGVARDTVSRLQQRYANADIEVRYFAPAPETVNPKLFKLQPALERCQQHYIVILDDDTMISPAALNSLLAALTRHTLATGLPHYRHGSNIASNLLAAFVNNNAAMTYLATLPFMAPITINGMAYAFKRDVYLGYGGFTPVMQHLTDDLAVAEQVLAQGGSICQTPDQQIIATHLDGWRGYVHQMHRWFVFAHLLFARKSPVVQLIMTLLYGLPPVILSLLPVIVILFPSLPALVTLLTVLLVRHLITIRHTGETVGNIRQFAVSLLAELLQWLHMLHAASYRTIRWRKRRYRVYRTDYFKDV